MVSGFVMSNPGQGQAQRPEATYTASVQLDEISCCCEVAVKTDWNATTFPQCWCRRRSRLWGGGGVCSLAATTKLQPTPPKLVGEGLDVQLCSCEPDKGRWCKLDLCSAWPYVESCGVGSCHVPLFYQASQPPPTQPLQAQSISSLPKKWT